ncbi:hypothetical protein [Natrononativus amylolyticus]|uniref:hypothetical protein n=1 Tax=Natrononativus amylolyticus TaxID=2963434 RepID=UPI0020CF2446|nr:hypothetical protein [Natrononativus amylolyticus]
MERRPARDTRPATSRRRDGWYGYGKRLSTEKHPVGCVLHDTARVFGDVSFSILPILFAVYATQDTRPFGVVTTGMVAWFTFVAVAVAIRGGWIAPLRTDVRGWVSLKLSLVAFRLVYYNLALACGVFGGVALATEVGTPPLSLAVGATVSTLAALAFPRLAESFYHRFVY